jgi:hypothetical protein
LEQVGDPVLEFDNRWRRFVELPVEVVEQLCDDASVGDRCAPHRRSVGAVHARRG